jgi:hypothetical protein
VVLYLCICVSDHIRSGLPTKHTHTNLKSQQPKYVNKTRNMTHRVSAPRFNLWHKLNSMLPTYIYNNQMYSKKARHSHYQRGNRSHSSVQTHTKHLPNTSQFTISVKNVCSVCHIPVASLRHFHPSNEFPMPKLSGYISFFPLSYGIILWGNSPHSISVFKMQKWIIRIMTKSRYTDSCKQLFKNWESYPYTVNIYFLIVICGDK